MSISPLLSMLILGFLLVETATVFSQENPSKNPPRTAGPPKVGALFPDLELQTTDGTKKRLKQIVANEFAVIVILRGFPGYQCPLCSRQVSDFIRHSEKFREVKSKVVFIYPGPRKDVTAKAMEFVTKHPLPDHFVLTLDPDYRLTEELGLRWNAANETAYPSTFVIDSDRRVRYAKVSSTHGDRAGVEEVVAALTAK